MREVHWGEETFGDCIWTVFPIFYLASRVGSTYPSIPHASVPPTTTSWPWRPRPLVQNHAKTWWELGRHWRNKHLQISGVSACQFDAMTKKKYKYSLKKHTFCPQAHWSAATRIKGNKIKNSLVSCKKLHCRVVQIKINHVTWCNHTHLENWSHWKPAGGGGHGVGVFCVAQLVLWLCVVVEIVSTTKKDSEILSVAVGFYHA